MRKTYFITLYFRIYAGNETYQMKSNILKKIVSIFSAVIIAALFSQLLILIGPFIGGIIVIVFKLSPNPQLANSMESFGNIFVLFSSIYVGVFVYRKIIGKRENEENT